MKTESEKKSKDKAKRHSKKPKRKESGVQSLKLLVLTQLGDVAKAEKYIIKHGNKSINSFDAEGFTPLHQVYCRLPVSCLITQLTFVFRLRS